MVLTFPGLVRYIADLLPYPTGQGVQALLASQAKPDLQRLIIHPDLLSSSEKVFG